MARRKSVSEIRKEQEAQTGSQAEGYFSQQPIARGAERVSGGKISSFPLSQIWPDRFQPRLIIPPDLRDRFFSGDLSVYETAFEWIKRAKGDQGEDFLETQMFNDVRGDDSSEAFLRLLSGNRGTALLVPGAQSCRQADGRV